MTLAHPAGPEEDGGMKRSGHDGEDVICMSERKVPVVEMRTIQVNITHWLVAAPPGPTYSSFISVLGPTLLRCIMRTFQVSPLKG